jgi:Protein of unknown function (DUF3102)
MSADDSRMENVTEIPEPEYFGGCPERAMSTEMIPLADLAGRINDEHRLAEQHARSAVEHALKCGELLIEAKGKVQHGEWLPWLKANCAVSERTAQAYMRLAHEIPKLDPGKAQRVADLPLREALKALSAPLGADAPTPSDLRALLAHHMKLIDASNRRVWALSEEFPDDMQALAQVAQGRGRWWTEFMAALSERDLRVHQALDAFGGEHALNAWITELRASLPAELATLAPAWPEGVSPPFTFEDFRHRRRLEDRALEEAEKGRDTAEKYAAHITRKHREAYEYLRAAALEFATLTRAAEAGEVPLEAMNALPLNDPLFQRQIEAGKAATFEEFCRGHLDGVLDAMLAQGKDGA